ncbi:MAG: helix-turn-helix domain-containing protein [Flavobacteriaceae bacterium]|nr:helix-turn-helix domain-containing protein [Flavobacteriaceae bacterium]
MKKYFYIISFILLGVSAFTQESSGANDLIVKAEENIYVNPDESIRIASQILRNTNHTAEVIHTNLILSKSYYAKGNLEEAFGYFFDGKKQLETSQDESKHLEYLLFGTTLFKNFGLYEITKGLKKEANYYLKSDTKEPLALIFDMQEKWMEADSIQNAENLKQLLSELESVTVKKNKETVNLKVQILNSLGKILLFEGKRDSSKIYFKDALNSQRFIQSESIQEAFILVDYSNYFFEHNQYHTAIDTLSKALNISKKFNNPFLDYALFTELSQNHLAIKNEEKFIETHIRMGQSLNAIKIKENAASNAIFNILQQNQIESKDKLHNEFVSTKWTFGIIAAMLIIITVFLRWFTVFKLKHTKDVINYLKLIQEFDKKEEPVAKGIVKSLGIPKETESLLLKKLDEFEKSNKFTSNEMSLAQMASQFETNTKYLSEIINKHKGKNFNLYINNLRVKYIVKKLKTEPNYLNYKVSYLAEESGFSSHSSFATVFKNITGISPNVFIELLKKDLKKNKQMSA